MPNFLTVLQEDIAARGGLDRQKPEDPIQNGSVILVVTADPEHLYSNCRIKLKMVGSGSTVSMGRLVRFERVEAANIEYCTRELVMLGDLDAIDHRRNRDTCDRM